MNIHLQAHPLKSAHGHVLVPLVEATMIQIRLNVFIEIIKHFTYYLHQNKNTNPENWHDEEPFPRSF
jgi:hypothetical protein